jgi:hypothetical protein
MKTGAAVFKFSKGRIGTSGANVGYITREKAAENRIWTRNLPNYATEGETRKERIDNLKEYARQQEENELEKSRTGSGETRTHYRAIYSFETFREITDEQAQRMIDEHLDKNFPDARVVAAIHRDTDNPHVHINIFARRTDDKKINISNNQYKTLDDDFARTCAREFDERNLYDDHINKKLQTQQWKRDYAEAKQREENTPEKPIRAADLRNQIQERRAMEAQQFGATYYDETRIGNSQRQVISAEPDATTGEQQINRAEREIDALNSSIAETNRAIEQANQQKQLTKDYDDERER